MSSTTARSLSLACSLVALAAAISAPCGAQSDLDETLRGLDVQSPEVDLTNVERGPRSSGSTSGGTPRFELLDLSVNFLGAFGTSTERDEEIRHLNGGGHDPRRRGFTFQNLELSMMGAVDPFFRFETHLLYMVDTEGESKFEVEEAFGTTSFLPYGLELEVGWFLTEIGLINPTHPHAWRWMTMPVIHSRLFGHDGMRGGGFRASWQPDTEFYNVVHFGMQNANGETMASFLANDEFYEEHPPGGRPYQEQDTRSFSDFVYLLRWEGAFETGEESTLRFGATGLFGPNGTGTDGETVIGGLDFRWRWRPVTAERGFPYFEVQGEYLMRSFDADAFTAAGPPTVAVPADTLEDHGFYLQGVWGFERGLAAGLRVEYASGSGEDVDAETGAVVQRSGNAFRADRLRISPLLTYLPSEFSRFRLQYTYDDSDHLDGGRGGDAHSIWLGVEFLLGKHPAHAY